MINPSRIRALWTAAWCAAAIVFVWVLHDSVSPAWTPSRAGFANVRGFSRGLVNFVVLPAGQPFQGAPWWSVVVCAAVLAAAGLRAEFTRAAAAAAVTGSVVITAAALAPILSPYRVVLAPRTFVLCLLLLCSVSLRGPGRWLRARSTPFLAGLIGLAFFASAMLQLLATFDGNYSGFVRISRTVASEVPFLQERPELARSLLLYDSGYDGQFVYFMAFDPFIERFVGNPNLYRPFVDNPPYRYGRIGFSLVTRLTSGGRPERFPTSMMWSVVAAHFVLALLLGAFAARHGKPAIAALWYLAIPGFTASLVSALPEAMAAAAIVGGILAWERQRRWEAAIAFGCAVLVRETAAVPLIALALAAGRREWKRSAIVCGCALAPAIAWRAYVAWRFFPAFGWAAVAPNPGDFGAPFAGLARLWWAGVTRAQPSPEISAALVFPVLLAAAFVLSLVLLAARRGPIEIAAAVYATVAISLNYSHIWSHVPSGERGTFELFLCLVLLLIESRERPSWIRRALAGLFVALAAYTFLLAPDASVSRAALLLVR